MKKFYYLFLQIIFIIILKINTFADIIIPDRKIQEIENVEVYKTNQNFLIIGIVAILIITVSIAFFLFRKGDTKNE